MNNKTAKEYVELPELKFPLNLKSGFVVTELRGHCKKCQGQIEDLRGEIRDYDQCSEVVFVGLCIPCKTVVTCRFRHYKDGRVIEPQDNGDWVEMETTRSWRTWLKIFWKWLFGRRKPSV